MKDKLRSLVIIAIIALIGAGLSFLVYVLTRGIIDSLE